MSQLQKQVPEHKHKQKRFSSKKKTLKQGKKRKRLTDEARFRAYQRIKRLKFRHFRKQLASSELPCSSFQGVNPRVNFKNTPVVLTKCQLSTYTSTLDNQIPSK